MIIDLIVGIVFGILNAVFSLIPTFDLIIDGPRQTAAAGGALYTSTLEVVKFLKVWDLIFPVSLILTCIGVLIAAKVFSAFVQFIRWVWTVIPAKGT